MSTVHLNIMFVNIWNLRFRGWSWITEEFSWNILTVNLLQMFQSQTDEELNYN